MFRSNEFDTIHVVCTDILCVVCIGLLFAEFPTVNTGLGRPMFWKPLCLLSTPEGLATTNYQLTNITYIFNPKVAHSVTH